MKFLSSLGLWPQSASTLSDEVDAITVALIIASLLLLGLVFGLIIWFSAVYRDGTTATRGVSERQEHAIEWTWTLGLLGAFLALYVWAAVVYFRMHAPPSTAEEVLVVGKQWMWKFQHANGRQELGELHAPAGRPVLLTMISQDVIHSLFIPAFRLKQDVLPGRYERAWFQATRTGEYQIFCTQYCGTSHAAMSARLHVLSAADYAQWLETGLPRTQPVSSESAANRVSIGRRLFEKTFACVQCHSAGSGVRCPALEGVFGSRVKLSDGGTVIADENYLRESIVDPSVKIVEGYKDLMPSYRGRASEEELLSLIAYLKSLGGATHGRDLSH